MGSYDAEAYLDWEMTVEQKINSHLVPEQHRVRQATSEFKDFAIIWWNELVNTRAAPQTWNALKEEMRARFVPPSYRRDLRKKLQRLDQGDMLVQEYYQELQKGMLRCGVVEDPEDQMVRFYGGLRREIHHIVDYKEYHSIQCLFHLSMLAEKELQGRQQRRRAPSRHDSHRRQPRRHPLQVYERPHLPPLAAHAAPHLRHHSDMTIASPWRLQVLQQNLLRPPLPQVAPPTSSATAARDLAICSEIAPANLHTLLLVMVGMLVLLMLKMKILLELTLQRLMMVMKRFLVQQRPRPIRP
jgi:hypothetical protein